MNNLYILTKQEFTSLYRFGKVPLNLEKIIKYSTDSEEIDTKIFETFMSLASFVGDEEYLIIRFEDKFINEIWLEIENVLEIIPLTEAAKYSYEMKFNTKINFSKPRFKNVVQKVEEETDFQEMKRGARVFLDLCKVKNTYKDLLPDEIIKRAYLNRINSIKSSGFKDDFFIHLLAYNRYDFFPKTALGYFYDVGEVLAHSFGKPTFKVKGSPFYAFLEKNKQNFAQKSFLEISKIISNSKEIQNFTQKLTENGLRRYIVAVIFLKFKEDLSDRDSIEDSDTRRLIRDITHHKNYDEKYKEELNFAIYLTGIFFGYKKFYDDLYELKELKIFKKKIKIEEKVSIITTEKQEIKVENKQNDIPDLIFKYVKENGHSKINPDIIDFIKKRTGNKYQVKNIKNIIKDDKSQRLELETKNKAGGVKLKD
ncbi:hypothetical protein F6A46_08995 [Tenacibaculum finnmarkense genomovar ulcerans]|uniref:hypothetical protein n=1 Tax=Tenacibaculum finnmarkense TaxID=2781243 RepID=UPI00187BC290|nr:hypothetical protein [Tenacibaculum finnmarkense]MBE7688369.1 hypothetical protein [Tenacibaculum finnmarkense genomovar ulcerans]MCD8400432.1 hypothetical protein [Tenacibaculum finnmarkense genomovar ulcerans]